MFTLFHHELPLELKAKSLALILAKNHEPQYLQLTDQYTYKKCVDIWYLMYLYDITFREYAISPVGMKAYVENSVEIVIENGLCSKFISTKLFGKYHSINDIPSLISQNNDITTREEWHYSSYHHRTDDKPAIIDYHFKVLHWYHKDKRHRDGDKPASMAYLGSMLWYYNDKKIRNSSKILPIELWHNSTDDSYRVVMSDGKTFNDNGIYKGIGAYHGNEIEDYIAKK